MTTDSVELVIHPVRLRILQCLESGPMTTQQMADLLPDVPKSSLYRHLKLLLEGEFVAVAEIRLVQGIQEKLFELSRPALLGPDDIADLSADDHLRYFTTYMMALLRGFASYLGRPTEIDFVEDRAGYSEVGFWATRQELDTFAKQLNEAMMPLLANKNDEGRQRHKIAIVTYPEVTRKQT